jgi:MYXO-CTERM domain-containing protein
MAGSILTHTAGVPSLTILAEAVGGRGVAHAGGDNTLGGSFAASAAAEPLVSVATLAMSLDVARLTDPDRWYLAFVNPDADGAGFDVLHFTLQLEDTTLLDETFTAAAAALTYFEDRVFELASSLSGEGDTPDVATLDVIARFEITTSNVGDGFSAEIISGVQPVTEPGAAVLLLAGAALFAIRRRSR